MSEATATLAELSCRECRKRKVKCSRVLPTCSGCTRGSLHCQYPSEAQKPGPKPGSHRRSKRVRVDTEGTSDDLRNDSSLAEPPTGPLARANHGRNEAPEQPAERRDYLNLASLIHPSHDTDTGPPSPTNGVDLDENTRYSATRLGSQMSIYGGQVCKALRTTESNCKKLEELYFSNMTAFSLFDPAKLCTKVQSVQELDHQTALLAAMFAFSSRFRRDDDVHSSPGPEDFYRLAVRCIEDALDSCGDSCPPIIILQAMVLTTFHELIYGARGKSWRSVGALVRLAYESELHLIDSGKFDSHNSAEDQSQVQWYAKEEKRRTWWAIWEMDVFASTVRRLPTAIDWSHNLTLLPVSDESWFKGVPETSCLLLPDTTERCRSVQQSGNKCAKAWFLLANSLMRDAHLLSDPHGLSRTQRGLSSSINTNRSDKTRSTTKLSTGMTILKNNLYHFNMSLPTGLRYRGEGLSFEDNKMHNRSCQKDSDVYSIHLMVQLTRMVLIIGNAVENMAVERNMSLTAHLTPMESIDRDQSMRSTETEPWKQYLQAAENVHTLICNSSPDHVQLVNPFVASTIWLAAAILLAYRFLGIHDDDRNKELIESNFNLLRTNFTQFVDFWGISSVFLNKLSHLQVKLERLVQARGNRVHARSGVIPQVNTEPGRTQDVRVLSQSQEQERQVQDWPTNPTNDLDMDNDLTFGAFDETIEGAPMEPGSQSLLYSGIGYDWELQNFLDDMFATQLMSS